MLQRPKSREPSAPRAAASLSVVIPTLDEGQNIGPLLADLAGQTLDVEVVVADGGSSDDTVALARRAGALVVEAPTGRGIQMNAGAARTGGEWLLFLHADSRLDDRRLLERAVESMSKAGSSVAAGRFELRFRAQHAGHRFAFLESKATLNRPYTVNGDQGLLVRRDVFDAVGGFDESLPFLEDQRIVEQLRRIGDVCVLPGTISTSARRFQTEGFAGRYLLMAVIMTAWSVDELELLDELPDAYRPQCSADRIDHRPIARKVLDYTSRDGLPAALRIWRRVGRLALDNAWQPFFLVDVWLSGRDAAAEHECLDLYDRLIAPVLSRRSLDYLGALAVLAAVGGSGLLARDELS